MRRTMVMLSCTVALATSFAGPSRAQAAPAPGPKASGEGPTHLAARVYLTWNAPYGDPRARSAIEVPCGDTTKVDTLYLCFDPGRDAAHFVGVTVNLYLRPTQGRRLPEFWKGGNVGLAGSPLTVDFGSDPEAGFETVWGSTSIGAPKYDFLETSGRLVLVYANGTKSGPPLRGGRVYGVARVMVRRPAESSDGCGAPMCVEWFSSRLVYAPGEKGNVNRGERHVSINSPDGGVCRTPEGAAYPKPWSPGSK